MREVIEENSSEVTVRAMDPNVSYDAKVTFKDHCINNWAVQSCCRRVSEYDLTWTGVPKYVPVPDIRWDGEKSGTPIPCYGHDGKRRFDRQGSKSSIHPLTNGELSSPYIFQS